MNMRLSKLHSEKESLRRMKEELEEKPDFQDFFDKQLLSMYWAEEHGEVVLHIGLSDGDSITVSGENLTVTGKTVKAIEHIATWAAPEEVAF